MDTLLTRIHGPTSRYQRQTSYSIPPTCNASTPDSTIALQGIVRGNDKVEKGFCPS